MATIKIKDLTSEMIIGINPEERDRAQKVVINVALEIDTAKAVRSDKIEDTFDYKVLTKKIIEKTSPTRFFLLEKLADFVLQLVMEDKRVKQATVEVDKPGALRHARSVSVTTSKTRKK